MLFLGDTQGSSPVADALSFVGVATALVGVHSGPKILLLDGNALGGRSVFTERDGGSDRRTVTMESCPGSIRSLTGDFVMLKAVVVVGDATEVACEDGLLLR